MLDILSLFENLTIFNINIANNSLNLQNKLSDKHVVFY
jgi:hypothetical protein